MKDLKIEEIGYILKEMKSLEAQYPKAKVIYNLERQEILITFPLPIDYGKKFDTVQKF